MTIERKPYDKGVELTVLGRIDTVTAPDLTAALMPEFAGDADQVTLNLAAVNYVSSAGLRTLLAAQKESKKRMKSFIIKNVVDEVMEVFSMTGFNDILTIE
ncbi:MAG: STAS domain-containing protein [Ruminococcus sp.]|jgi:anti-sigma B factor antagonist|nr:STAS domain-containing protein [Ruminococcus sp.]